VRRRHHGEFRGLASGKVPGIDVGKVGAQERPHVRAAQRAAQRLGQPTRLDGIVIGPTFFEAMTGTGILNSNTVTGLNAGRSAFANSSSGYAVITPIAAANYSSMSGVTIEPCSEGGQDVGSINPGDWTAYSNLTLSSINTFVARVASASAGGNIEIHLDSPAGTLVGPAR
jgi:hypothetical protein